MAANFLFLNVFAIQFMLQTDPDIFSKIAGYVERNPGTAILTVALVILVLSTRSSTSGLSEDRKQLREYLTSINSDKTADNLQNAAALRMAETAIGKMDIVAASLDKFATSQHELSISTMNAAQKYYEAADLISVSNTRNTDKLVDQIIRMQEKQSEDDIYANENLKRGIYEMLGQSELRINVNVERIITEAKGFHAETRAQVEQTVGNQRDVLLAALASSPPPQANA